MQLARYQGTDGPAVGRLDQDQLIPLDLSQIGCSCLADILESQDPASLVAAAEQRDGAQALDQVTLLAPIDRQEVWAAGVTYKRSQTARMEESETSASCYDLVYEADRPEIFFKATPARVSGPSDDVRIRWDSHWNVPEPELTLVVNSRQDLVGFTIGNDMSSRDIEGENPLYLPQAKLYDQAAALGPCITLKNTMPPLDQIGIQLSIERDGAVAFAGTTDSGQLARSFEDLIGYLCREQTFADGVFLMTGTGIVPDSDFTLEAGDLVQISIDGIGRLSNRVIRGTQD